MKCTSCSTLRDGSRWGAAQMDLEASLSKLNDMIANRRLQPGSSEVFNLRDAGIIARNTTLGEQRSQGWLLPKTTIETDVVLALQTGKLYEDSASLLGNSCWVHIWPIQLCACSAERLTVRLKALTAQISSPSRLSS